MRRRLCSFAALALLFGATGYAGAGPLLYVTSTTGEQVLSVDVGNNQVTPVFNTIGNPDSLVFDTHGDIIYSSVVQGQLRSYNPSTKVDTLLGGGLAAPADLALTPDGGSVLVSEANAGKILKINLATHAGSQLGSYGGNTQGLAFDTAGHLFAVLGSRSAMASSFIAQLDPTTGAILNKSEMEVSLDGLTYDSLSKKLYSGSFAGNGIYQFDPATLNATLLANTTGVKFDGLTTDSAGDLYLAAGGFIYQYNLATAMLTQETHVPGLDDLAPLTGLGSNPVPEPGSLSLLGAGTLCVIGCSWRRERKNCPVKAKR
jgi:sugar lactone lactonase YvrE